MGIYRRDGSKVWQMTFCVSGKQIRQTTGTEDKKLAERIYRKILGQIAEGKWFELDVASRITFEEMAAKYEDEEYQRLKSKRSTQGYLKQLKAYFGSYALGDLNPALFNEFIQMRKKKGVKSSTINRQLNLLRRMLNLAKKRWLWIKDVPPIEMERNADTKRVRHLSFEEYHKLLEHCDGWLKDLVIVAAWTGLRQGNILNLRKSQIDLKDGTISVDGAETKNQENLVIPISAPALEVLGRALQAANPESPYVFAGKDGKQVYQMELHRAFKKVLEKAKIEDFRWHDLRHCFASWNRQAGVDLDTLADLLGHKDTRMTRRYAHITPSHLRHAVGLLEKSYGGVSTFLAQSPVPDGVEPAK